MAIWVGIDGYTSGTVEQTGILGECNHGSPSYSAWYEFYPAGMVTFSSQPVAPGDGVSASVSGVPGATYSVSLSVNGHTTTVSGSVASAQGTSAEWIVERPALCTAFNCRLTTLANFGAPLGFTGATATVGGSTGQINTNGFSDVAITMVGGSSGPVLAEPSSLGPDGSSFTVTYG